RNPYGGGRGRARGGARRDRLLGGGGGVFGPQGYLRPTIDQGGAGGGPGQGGIFGGVRSVGGGVCGRFGGLWGGGGAARRGGGGGRGGAGRARVRDWAGDRRGSRLLHG